MFDEVDQAIISFLQYDGRMPFTQIAQELGVTEGAVRRRVNKLVEENKLQIVGIVEPQEIGWKEAGMIAISVQPDRISDVADAIAQLPEVVYLFQAAGEFDLFAEVYCKDKQHFVSFLNEKLQKIPGIERTRSFLDPQDAQAFLSLGRGAASRQITTTNMELINQQNKIAELVHEKSVEILEEVGFCVPEPAALKRLEAAGFQVDHSSMMVRIPPELLESALQSLPQNVRLYDRAGQTEAAYESRSCFMGAGTPVNVFDLHSGERRPATRLDVRQLVRLQDALPQVDVVRPTVTATDQGECSDLVEIAELLLNTSKPVVHRTLAPERVDAAVEMLAAVRGARRRCRARPNFATLYCPISPGYFTAENVRCMLRWAEHGVPVTLLSMAMGGAFSPRYLAGRTDRDQCRYLGMDRRTANPVSGYAFAIR